MIAGRSETRDFMRIDWDVEIAMDDGVVLRADVFRPIAHGHFPVLITHGPYGKGVAFYDAHFKPIWEILTASHPETAAASSNRYQVWELPDPERWVRDGYVCVRVDSRGAGRSPGILECFSPREIKDFYDCIEWAGVQSWSNGKVGIDGISYYAMNQWLVASLNPPHLAAMCAWEGAADSYRDHAYHGGMLCTFWRMLLATQIKPIQHGVGVRGLRSRVTGELVSGPETLPEEALAANDRDYFEAQLAHPLDDDWHKSRSPAWDKVTVPFLSAGNWGGQGLHLRGNTEAFMRAASNEKYLEIHGLEHWTHFYTDYGVALQKRFFDFYLKGEENGWREGPRVRLQVRHVGNRFIGRHEDEWPLARTQWTKFYLDPAGYALTRQAPEAAAAVSYAGLGDGVTFLTSPFASETEITGPVAAKLFVSSSTEDADLFLVLKLYAPDMREIVFIGAVDPLQPPTLGWLRASHRKLDAELSLPYRPYHTHDEAVKLTPGETVECDIELWPTSIVIPAGYRLGLSVRGKDHVASGAKPRALGLGRPEPNGIGPFFHDHGRDRPAAVFGGAVTLHASPGEAAFLLLPIVPAKAE
jgi:predicted acyl esterase